MAKIKRVIRKLKPAGHGTFDDQMWPVAVALVILAFFLIGMSFAYLTFETVWAPLLLVIGILLSCGGAAVAVHFIGNRIVKRSMQLALVISVVAHVLIFIIAFEAVIFARYGSLIPPLADLTEQREPIIVPEYSEIWHSEPEDRPQQDFERPVEVETPDPEVEEVEREETEPEKQPTEQQETPVPEPERTVEPEIVRRETPQETSPRQNEQQSRLSRQMNQNRPQPNTTAVPEVVQSRPTQPTQLNASRNEVQRQQTETQVTQQSATNEPTVTTQQQTVQMSRQQTQQAPQPQTTSAPTMQRSETRPVEVPKTQVQVENVAAQTRQTQEQAQPQPNTTAATRQETASPTATPKNVEPTPQTPTEVTPEVQRREAQTEPTPQVAATPQNVPNQRTRMTTRPDVTANATVEAPNPTPTQAQAQPTQITANTSPVQRNTTEQRAVEQNVTVEPTTSQQQTVARLERAQTQQTPTTETAPTPTTIPRRTTPTNTPSPSATAQIQTPTPTAQNPTTQQVEARATETARQATANAQVAQNVSQPTVDAPSATPTETTVTASRRTPQAEAAPTVAQATQSTPTRQAQPTPQIQTSAVAANVSPSPNATPSEQLSSVQATTSPVQRANTSDVQSAAPSTNVAANVPTQPSTQPSQNSVQRRTTNAPAPTVQVDATASNTPSRSQTSPTAATPNTSAVAESVPTPSPTQATAGQVAAASTSASRQSTSTNSQTLQASAEPSVEVTQTTPSSGIFSGAASRQPNAVSAPQVAQSNSSVSRQRTSAQSTPSVNTVASNVDAPQSPVQAESQHLAASSATVSRQTSANSPQAARTQPTLETPAASNNSRVAQTSHSRAATTTNAPSIAPDAPATGSPQRSVRAAAIAASPAAVESPAVAQATQGEGDPSAQPARTAIARSTAGTAGRGESRNMDRALEAADSPSMVASASANRATATQNTPEGPAISPSNPAQIARATADANAPSATTQAAAVAVASQMGAETPTELNASASAALARSDSNAESAPVTAAKGSLEVDIGPTRVVSENSTGRASGGGQPELNTYTDLPSLPRSCTGGATQVAIASTSVSEVPVAPAADGGGAPAESQSLPDAAALARTDPGSSEPISGGPSKASETGPTTEVSMTEQVARNEVTRAEAAEAMAGEPAAGGGDPDEDEEERRRRLAMLAAKGGTGPTIAMSTTVEIPAGASGAQPAPESGQPAGGTPGPQETQIARSSSAAGGAPAAGGPSAATQAGPSAQANTATQIAQSAVSRAASSEAAAGNPLAGGGDPSPAAAAEIAQAVQRSRQGGAPQLAMAGPITAPTAAATQTDASGGSSSAPPTIDATPDASTVARIDAGASRPAAGEPAAAAQAGPATAVLGGEVATNQPLSRAESVQAATGPAEIGGGSQAPERSATGPVFAASTRAETVSVSGEPGGPQTPEGALFAAQGAEASRMAGGMLAIADTGPTGTLLGDTAVDGDILGRVGSALGERQSSSARADGPVVASADTSGGPHRQAPQATLPTGAVAVAPVGGMGVPSEPAANPDDTMGELAGGLDVGPMSRDTGSSIQVEVQASIGPGGLGAEAAPDAGLNTRRAREESVAVTTQDARFVRQDFGGRPSFSTAAIVAADPFSDRSAQRQGDPGGGGRGSLPPETEASINIGLAFLSRYQQPDGRWTLQQFKDERPALATDTAATGLALMAFLGAGYNHREFEYASQLKAAIDFLISNQKENGDLFVPLDDASNQAVWLYSHAVATYALCEAYGATQDPDIKEPVQRAIDFIAESQNVRGGWRYAPSVGSDTSVSGWMMGALHAGRLAKLKVPDKTLAGVRSWLDVAKTPDEKHLFRYNPYAPKTEKQEHGRRASEAMTSVGLLMEHYLGMPSDDPTMLAGADYLLQEEHLPAIGTSRNPQRDTYYWFYATQVMFGVGGEHWETWNNRLHPLLLNTQIKNGPLAGSWDPNSPIPDRWGPHAGRIYVTTMNLLSLEVRYRHLPTYVGLTGAVDE